MVRKGSVRLAGAAVVLGSFATCGAGAAALPGPARASTHVRPGARMIRPAPRGLRPTGGSAPAAVAGGPMREAFSTNWSGYAVSGGHYRRVSARWAEPAAACSDSRSQFSSFWVGLDGLDSDTVEQIGTEVDCASGKPAYSSWYEMYPGLPKYFRDRVRPGDRLAASIEYRGGDRYVLALRDATSRWRHLVRASLSGGLRDSAEVIAEAPSSPGGVLPLTDFGDVRFARVTVNGSAIGRYHPTQITMVDANGSPQDTVSALGGRGGGEDFTIAWRHG